MGERVRRHICEALKKAIFAADDIFNPAIRARIDADVKEAAYRSVSGLYGHEMTAFIAAAPSSGIIIADENGPVDFRPIPDPSD